MPVASNIVKFPVRCILIDDQGNQMEMTLTNVSIEFDGMGGGSRTVQLEGYLLETFTVGSLPVSSTDKINREQQYVAALQYYAEREHYFQVGTIFHLRDDGFVARKALGLT